MFLARVHASLLAKMMLAEMMLAKNDASKE
jgi:hypothetical protein